MIYFETSSKDGDNIDYAFTYATEKLLEYYSSQKDADLKKTIEKTIQLQSQNFKEIRIEEHKQNVVIYNEIYLYCFYEIIIAILVKYKMLKYLIF